MVTRSDMPRHVWGQRRFLHDDVLWPDVTEAWQLAPALR
jgi:hypothetical protein